MSRTIYERISKFYDDIDKSLKSPYYDAFNNNTIKKYDIKKLNTLKIIIELIDEKNNIEIDDLFNKYLKDIKFKKEYYKRNKTNPFINGDKIDTFENISDFIDKLENVKINDDTNNCFYNDINMYDELYDILLKVQEQEKIELLKKEEDKKMKVIKKAIKKEVVKEVKKTSSKETKTDVKKKEKVKDIITDDNDKKKKKKPISATIKRLVWNTNIGEDIGKSKCMCCYSTDITQMSFNCGHIVAEANGGDTIVSNLKPICQNCNSSMGTKNMEDFMKSLK
jgi:5-methylcytosine-specific restriction endonuclease McrA